MLAQQIKLSLEHSLLRTSGFSRGEPWGCGDGIEVLEFSGLRNTSFCPDVAFFSIAIKVRLGHLDSQCPGLGIAFFELYAKRSIKTSFIQKNGQKRYPDNQQFSAFHT